MGDQQKKINLPSQEVGENKPLKFDESEYFKYLQDLRYKDRQIRKLRNGINHIKSIISIEELIPHLTLQKNLKKFGKEFRRVLSSDSAKNARTCAGRIRDYALVRGLIKEGNKLSFDIVRQFLNFRVGKGYVFMK